MPARVRHGTAKQRAAPPSPPEEVREVEETRDDTSSQFSEAEEVGFESEAEDEAEAVPEEEEGEDLFGDDFERDYEPQPELDRYDEEVLDDAPQPAIDAEARLRAEREMSRRDRREETQESRTGAAGRFYGGLSELLAEEEEEDDHDVELRERRHRRRERFRDTARAAQGRPLPQQADQAKEELPFCDGQTSWSARVEEILEVLLQGFIWFYTADEETEVASDMGFYLEKLNEMVRHEKLSLHVDFRHLAKYSDRLSDWFVVLPNPVITLLDTVVTDITRTLYSELYGKCQIAVRLVNFEGLAGLRMLRTNLLNQLVAVEGVIIRRSAVNPKLRMVYMECLKCGSNSNGPFDYRDGQRPKMACVECQSKGPFIISKERTVYQAHQRLVLQESPGQVAAGNTPRQKTVIVLGDLVDTVRPGDEVLITGIFQTRPDSELNARTGFPICYTEILANNVQRKSDIKLSELTEKDEDIIKRLSKNPQIRDKVIRSIAPSIYGHWHVKTGVAMVMFGGVRRERKQKEGSNIGKHTIRGDINMLILGDPGMAKSQFLKYVEKTFDRTVFTTGKGASASGLTASMKRDPTTGEWSLEGGALVLADQGICLIDEFDKMTDRDRVSIHEAMEQQSISISKAGIVTSLRARCAVVAAANPIFGRYDSSLTFTENVDLGDTILSRFDVLAVLKDHATPIQDECLADYVVSSHILSHPDLDAAERTRLQRGAAVPPSTETGDDWINGKAPIPQDILRKYIMYARKMCHPEFRGLDEQKLTEFYAQLRQASLNSGGLPLTVRHLESVLRMATANAKIRLSQTVERKDLDLAISTMLESFIQSQKHAVAVNLGTKFGRYRALACSPNEFVEMILIDLITRKAREQMLIGASNHHDRIMDGDTGGSVISHYHQAEAKLSEVVTLARNLYAIPAATVGNYINSGASFEKFCTRREDGETYIRMKQPEADRLSVYSQESQESQESQHQEMPMSQ